MEKFGLQQEPIRKEVEVTVPENISVYGGFVGTETDFSERDIENNQVIIDGQDLHRCIKNVGEIDGLIFINGKISLIDEAALGGGVYNEGIIRNCSISTCSASAVGNDIDSSGGGVYNSGTMVSCIVYGQSTRYIWG